MKTSDLDDGQRIGFSLRSVTIAQNERGEPVTAPVAGGSWRAKPSAFTNYV